MPAARGLVARGRGPARCVNRTGACIVYSGTSKQGYLPVQEIVPHACARNDTFT